MDGPMAAARNETEHMGTVKLRGMHGVCVCLCACARVYLEQVYGSKAEIRLCCKR